MQQQSPIYITTSIPYVNGRPHVGHALEDVQTDVFARYHRQTGRTTRLGTGSDDNSLKNVLAAEREGITVAELVQRNAQGFRDLLDTLGVGYDCFLHTSADRRHGVGVTALWQACVAAGAIYRRFYGGLYCVGCEQFYAPEDLTSTGLCPDHLTPPERVEEENYFFRLSQYGQQLQTMIREGHLRIVPESRRNEVLAFIGGGLEDFSISRSQVRARGWGVPVPDDPSQVMYVWFDALGNYITQLGFGSADQGESALYRQFWANGGERIHVIGKGILRFHAVYWPAMLLAAGLPLPTTVFAHGYLTVEGQKIGKSMGNAVDPAELIASYGAAALRWYLLREIPATADADFSVARMINRYNTDLANDLGNLLNRVNAMLHRYREGVVPAPGALPPGATELREIAALLPERLAAAMGAYDPRLALEALWDLVGRANRLVDEAAPWTLAAAQRGGDAAAGMALDTILYALLEALRQIGLHLEPFLPDTAAGIQRNLAIEADRGQPYNQAIIWGGLVPGTHTPAPVPLFPRIEAAAEAVAVGERRGA